MATVATKYNSRRTVKYPLQLVKSLFGAAKHVFEFLIAEHITKNTC